MSSFNYSSLAETAARLINRFGKVSVYIRSVSGETDDPVAGTVTGGTSTDTLVNAVEVNYNEKYQPGAMIEMGDRMLSMDAQPAMSDKIIIDGEIWHIAQVWPKRPGDTLVAAFVQVRK